MLTLSGACGTDLRYDIGLLESLEPLVYDTCRLVRSLTRPPARMYIRVNTLKVSVEEYLDIARSHGITLYRDEEIPEALWHPIHGPFSIEVHDKIVVADKRASEAVMLGSDLYMPGVLSAKNVEAGDLVTIVAPNGIPVASGRAVTSLRHGRLFSRGIAVKVEESMYKAIRTQNLPGYEEGLVYGQSLPSMYVARILDPKPGELIVDMTAAPGGKVSHIAQLAGPDASILAVDRKSKVERLRLVLKRLGLNWVNVVSGDSRYLSRDMPKLRGRVDAVVVDPPCSNLGVIPKILDELRLSDVISYSLYQRQFINEAWRLLKKGGRLIYSTCTLTYLENEYLVKYAIDLGFELAEPLQWISRGSKGLYGLRFHPHQHGTPGFFLSWILYKA